MPLGLKDKKIRKGLLSAYLANQTQNLLQVFGLEFFYPMDLTYQILL